MFPGQPETPALAGTQVLDMLADLDRGASTGQQSGQNSHQQTERRMSEACRLSFSQPGFQTPATEEDLASFETDVLAGFVLARASAGLVDSTIRNDTNHLELIRDWFARPL